MTVTGAGLWQLALGTLTGLGASTLFVLALFIGFCVVFGFSKLRATSRKTMVIRNFDDLDGGFQYLPADAPRGPADQLRSPELLEQGTRQA